MLHIDRNRLLVVQICRNLGVGLTVCSDMAPAVHIDQNVAKAHQRANTILRCFVSRDQVFNQGFYNIRTATARVQ